jgi:TPR repeat protein
MTPEKKAAEDFLASTRLYLKISRDENWPFAYKKFRTDLEPQFQVLLAMEPSREPDVWFALAHGFSNGWGIEQNKTEAERLLRLAAGAGHSQAMCRLACILLYHPDRKKDQHEAIGWLQKSSYLKNSSAMTFLGFAYSEGRCVPQDYELAVSWFLAAFNHGEKHAAVHAAKILWIPLGRDKEAVDWLLVSAKNNDKESYIYLGLIYGDKKTPFYDPSEAVKWYKIAVEKSGLGSKRSHLHLARHYYKGEGVPKSKEIARNWLMKLFSQIEARGELYREGIKLLRKIESKSDSHLPMKKSRSSKYLLHSIALCVEGGEIGGGKTPVLFDSRRAARKASMDEVKDCRKIIEKEIQIINNPDNKLLFTSAYVFHVAVFRIPAKFDSAEGAQEWLQNELENDKDISKKVIYYEGASIDSYGEKATDLGDYLSHW